MATPTLHVVHDDEPADQALIDAMRRHPCSAGKRPALTVVR